MGKHAKHYLGGVIGVDPLVSSTPRNSGVFSLGALSGDGAATAAIPQGSTSFDGSNDYIEVGAQAQNIDLSGAFTIEAWVRLNSTSGNQKFFDLRTDTVLLADTLLIDYSNGFRCFVGGNNQTSSPPATVNTWHHIAAVRDGSNDFAFFKDGSRVASTSSSLDFTLDYDFVIGINGDDFYDAPSTIVNPLNGFMSEVRISDTARYDPALASISVPTAQFEDDTNTLMLLRLNETALSDVANSSRTITANGVSNSTNVYKFTTVPAVAGATRPARRWGGMTGRSLVATTAGTPATSDFATFDPASAASGVTLSNNNLSVDHGTTSVRVVTNQSMSTGKYYCEFRLDASNNPNTYGQMVGLVNSNGDRTSMLWRTGAVYGASGSSTYGNATTAVGTIVGVAFDADAGSTWFALNGFWQNSAVAADIADGTDTNYAHTGLSGPLYFGTDDGSSGDYGVENTANFGQDATFNGAVTPSTTYTDANGFGAFYYEPPSGFVGLYTAATSTNVPTTGVLSLPELLQASYGGLDGGVTASEYIVVAGGGGGGYHAVDAGGGGAGGVRQSSSAGALTGTYTITVGAGGARGTAYSTGPTNGGNSAISGAGLTVTATGGGRGGQRHPNTSHENGGAGGSGGGGNKDGNGGAGSSGQGYAGSAGNGTYSSRPNNGGGPSGGGGGGAGEAGDTDGEGFGGDGITNSLLNAIGHGELSGGKRYVAGGGGGAYRIDTSAGIGGEGGLGGGGDGAADQNAQSGTNGFGGGGGGGLSGGTGGSGVVIIKTDAQATGTTGTVTETQVGSDWYYKFTGNGTVTFP